MRNYLLSFLFLTGMAACTERMDISTDNPTPRLVITGYITTEKAEHIIQVSRTVGYFGHESPKLYSNASVKINNIPLKNLENGNYCTAPDFYGKPDSTYKLEVWVDFDEDGEDEYYTASATMPSYPVLDSVSFIKITGNKPYWFALVHFRDVPGPNHYGAHLYLNRVDVPPLKYSKNIPHYFLNPFNERAAEGDNIVFPTYVIQEEMNWINDEKIMLHRGDTIMLELNLLSPEYFEFIRTAKEEIEGGNPLFAGPPANVPGNISGNALGIFGAYTVSRAYTIFP